MFSSIGVVSVGSSSIIEALHDTGDSIVPIILAALGSAIADRLLVTIYHAFGIEPDTIVYNHLNQPRELVKAQAIMEVFA